MALCPGKVIVFQICNENSVIDDNFNIVINGTLLGLLDLNANAQVGAVFIGSTDPTLVITQPDFPCPLALMDVYRFDDALLNIGANTLDMINVQMNGFGNFGTVGIRAYDLVGFELVNPVVIQDLTYSGGDGESFSFGFDFACPDGTGTDGLSCVCCCPDEDAEELFPEELVFILPTTINGLNVSITTTPPVADKSLSLNIVTTTTTSAPIIPTTSTTSTPSLSFIPIKPEEGCNYLNF